MVAPSDPDATRDGDSHDCDSHDGDSGTVDAGPRSRMRDSLPPWVHRGVGARVGVDVRALAAFRVSLGLLVLADLLLRARELRTFYTDAGVLPRSSLAASYPLFAEVSLHAQTGSAAGQAVLFAVAAVLAVALAVGYRTRFVTVVVLGLHASLYARNPYVLNGGDGLLVLGLFLGAFLPLGRRWSVDAVRRDRGGGSDPDRHGRADEAGQAAGRALDAEQEVGGTLGAEQDTGGALAAEQDAGGPLDAVGDADRVTTLATATLLLQLVIVYAANALFKLRSDAWTSGQAVQYVLELEQFSILIGPYLAGFPRLSTLLTWLWFGMLWGAPLLVLATGRLRVAVVVAFAAAHLGMLLTMRLGFFPLVVWALLALYLPGSVWDRLERRLRAWSLDAAGTRAAAAFLARGPALAARRLPRRPVAVRRRSRPAGTTASSLRRAGRAMAIAILVVALVASVVWPAAALGAGEGTPLEDVGPGDYTWTLFAPNTPSHVVWFVAPVTLSSGTQVDGIGGGPVEWAEPADAADAYPGPLWHRYLMEVRWSAARHRPALAGYLCRRVAARTGEQPTEVAIYVLERPVAAAGGGDASRSELGRYDCRAVSPV